MRFSSVSAVLLVTPFVFAAPSRLAKRDDGLEELDVTVKVDIGRGVQTVLGSLGRKLGNAYDNAVSSVNTEVDDEDEEDVVFDDEEYNEDDEEEVEGDEDDYEESENDEEEDEDEDEDNDEEETESEEITEDNEERSTEDDEEEEEEEEDDDEVFAQQESEAMASIYADEFEPLRALLEKHISSLFSMLRFRPDMDAAAALAKINKWLGHHANDLWNLSSELNGPTDVEEDDRSEVLSDLCGFLCKVGVASDDLYSKGEGVHQMNNILINLRDALVGSPSTCPCTSQNWIRTFPSADEETEE